MNIDWQEFKREIESQFHDDYKPRYCTFPDCSCGMDYEGDDWQCDLPDKPRYRIFFFDLDEDKRQGINYVPLQFDPEWLINDGWRTVPRAQWYFWNGSHCRMMGPGC